jgi:hypothetical protein
MDGDLDSFIDAWLRSGKHKAVEAQSEPKKT